MNENLLNRILRDHKRRTRSLALILCLSMLVSLGTFAGFHKTAVAKVYTNEVLDCPYAHEGAEKVAHTHNDDCYDGETLVCSLPEIEAHTHTEECFVEREVPVCGLEENPGHQHTESCYTEREELRCGLEENPGHQHGQNCYNADGVLICTIPEGEGAHTHTPECYETVRELTCTIPEGEGAHTHTAECYETVRELICDKPELPVHVHGPECFRTEEVTAGEEEKTLPEMPVGDPNADLETASDWERDFDGMELSGNWATDLVLVAATQQGHGESPNNFEAVLNDAGDAWVRHGYTRYGAWYGAPYAEEWSAMFVSFCLRYAGIPVENVPNNPTAAYMAESFSKGELFAGRDYVPAVGDLIFFDTGKAEGIDHMGIVYYVDEENGTINTVEGDRSDAVATFGYHLDDEEIVGYGILPQNPNYIPAEDEDEDEAPDSVIVMTTDEEENEETKDTVEETVPAVPMPAQSWERTAGGIKVVVEAPEGAFPENTQIAVTPVNGNNLKDTVSDAVNGEILEVQAVDITFFNAEGREIEPAVPIRVVMTPYENNHTEDKANVVHIDLEQQTAEVIAQAEGTETDNSEVVFDAEAFTIYAIVYTVHFEYEVDGETYTSASMPGAEYTSLAEVIRGLGIVSEKEVGTFVSKISTVASTNEEVAVVETVEGVLNIRVLKDGDAQIVITMQDGATFRVDVVADGETEVSDENNVATISTVGDLYLPEGAKAAAKVVDGDEAIEAVKAETGEETEYTVFDISLENVDTEKYEEGFEVTIALDSNITGKDFRLYHIHDGQMEDITGSLEVLGTTDENGVKNISGFTFQTGDFSEFVLSYTVDFYYGEYEYHMMGGGQMLLSELLEALGINVDVADVMDVTFTNYSLMSVERVEEETVLEVGATGDGEDEIWAITDPDEDEEIVNNETPDRGTRIAHVDDWILQSLKAFSSDEELTVITDSDRIVIVVTDEQFEGIDVSDTVDLAAWADAGLITLNVSTDSQTQNVDRDAAFNVKVNYVFTTEALKAIQGYVNEYNKVPKLVYDFSSTLADPALKDSISGGLQYLSTGKKRVGTIDFESSGRVVMDITDWGWFLDRSSLRGNFTFEIETQASGIDDSGSEHYQFPGTSDTIDVTYKETYTIKNKSYNAIDNGDGSYRINYSVEFKNTNDMSSLQYIDTYSGMQALDANSVKVNGESVSVQASDGRFTYDFPKNSSDGEKVAAGDYKIEYSTIVTAEQYEAMQKGTSSQEVNTAKWQINGSDPKDGGTTTYTITRPTDPVPPVPVEKTSTKENQEVQPGDTITYTVSFGDSETDLAGLQIIDRMTDLQTLVSGSMSMTIGGQSVTLPENFIKYNDDGHYSRGDVEVFNYTFDENDTRKGPVVITYTTKVIDKNTAKANNIYEGVTVSNVGQEGRGWKQDRTDSTVTFDKEEIIVVDKSVTSVSLSTDDGKWQPGATVNYQIVVGDGTVSLANVRVTDKMTDLQTLNTESVEISYDGGSTFTPLTDGIVYADDGVYGTNEVDVLNLVLSASAGNGPVYIRYSTTVISQETIDTQNLNNYTRIYGEKVLNNTATAGNKSDSDGGHVPYEEEPKFPAEKSVKSTGTYVNENGETVELQEGNMAADVDINGQEVKPGEIVTYSITVGDAETSLGGVMVMDEFTDIQVLVYDSVIITLPNGSVYKMPAASDHWSADGVVWSDYEDDGMYSTNSVRVFYYTFPENTGNGPAIITYQAQIISEEDAKSAGLSGLKNAINSVLVGNNNPRTEIKPHFPEEYEHKPAVQKIGTGIDAATNTVKWRITVDKEAGSAFPLDDVYIYEHVYWESPYFVQTPLGYANWMPSEASWYDMLNATVTTESGKILSPIKDYDIHKGSGYWDKPYFYFKTIEEPVYIDIEVHLPYNIAENPAGHEAENIVDVNHGTNVKAEQDYEATDITVGKFGTNKGFYTVKGTDEQRAVIEWKVYINAAKEVVNPDTTQIVFSDIVPEGLELIDYNALKSNNEIDTSRFSMSVNYEEDTTGLASHGPNNTYVFDNYDGYDGLTVVDGRTIQPVNLQLNKTIWYTKALKDYQRGVGTVPNPDGQDAVYGLSHRRLEIVYYTALAAGEWEKIASSADGSKTYENTVNITDGGTRSWDGTGEETITIEKPIQKFDDTDENGSGIVVGADGNVSTLITYRVNINSQGLQLNGGKTLTLTDRIATNIELDTDSVRIYPGTLTKDQVAERFASDEGIKPGDEGYEDLTISYNGDTRALTIIGLHDATPYTFVYKADARAQGEDTFTNTATLIGGGSHSSTVTDRHDIETLSSGIAGESLTMYILKVDENDITAKISNAEFDLYELTLGIDTSTLSDDEWINLLAEMDSKDPERMREASEKFNIVSETKIDTSEYNGKANDYRFPNQTGAGWKEKTVYYFVETEPGYNADEIPYTLDKTKHYFVLYPAIIYNGNDPDENAVKLHQRIAWALDDATSYANGITIASLASDTQWKATNILSEVTSVNVSKIWENDADNFFETRPNKGITLHLMQVDEEGNETEYTQKSPVVIRASKYTDVNGNTREFWPDYTWTKLPSKYEGNKTYHYYVKEDAVEGYTTVYSISDPIEGGDITVTNRMIPKSINITAHKTFNVPEGTEIPEQIVLKLYRYTTTKAGVTTGPAYTGISQAVTINNDWSTTFDSMPTTGPNGESYKYIILEDTKALEKAGYTYVVEYEGNNDEDSLDDADKGVVEGEITITNSLPGRLEVEKTIAGIERELNDEEKAGITFTVTGPNDFSQSFTYADMTDGKKILENLVPGDYTVTETNKMNPEGYTQKTTTYKVGNGDTAIGNSGRVAVIGDETATIVYTNTYEQPAGSLKLTKHVTVNGETTTGTTADGTYTFRIDGPEGASEDETVSKTVEIIVTNGVAASATVDGKTAALDEDKYVIVSGLAAGTYTITETEPTNGTAISKINGLDSKVYSTTATVTVGDTIAEAEGASVSFTNNYDQGYLKVHKEVTYNGVAPTTTEQKQALAGTYTFKIYTDENCKQAVKDGENEKTLTVTIGADGEAADSNVIALPVGTYWIQEQTPEQTGVTPEDNPLEISITRNHTSEAPGVVSFVNNREDSDNPDELAIELRKTFTGLTGSSEIPPNFMVKLTYNVPGSSEPVTVELTGITVGNVTCVKSTDGMTWQWHVTHIPSNATDFKVSESNYDITGYTLTTKINGETVENPANSQSVTVLVPTITMTNVTKDYTTTDNNKVFTVADNQILLVRLTNHATVIVSQKSLGIAERTAIEKMINDNGGKIPGDDGAHAQWVENYVYFSHEIQAESFSYGGNTIYFHENEVRIPHSSSSHEVRVDIGFTSESAQNSFTIENDYTEIPITIEIEKVKKDATTVKLPGAVFILRQIADSEPVNGVYPNETGVKTQTSVPTAEGTGRTSFTGLTSGYYELKETIAPSGYVLTGETVTYFKISGGVLTWLEKSSGKPSTWLEKTNKGTGELISFTPAVAADPDNGAEAQNAIFVVENAPGTQLPETGGIGTTLFTALGGLMTVAAGAILTMCRGKRKTAES